MTAVLFVTGLAALVDKTPQANDVKAGWTAFAVFLGLGLAVVLLGISLTRHLRRTDQNAEHGVYDQPER
ncbi:MAG TPA: hypothetical protein VFL69_03330 [Marmoricola sp.]|nr:hypothetical protein [Marmoricola sp.]